MEDSVPEPQEGGRQASSDLEAKKPSLSAEENDDVIIITDEPISAAPCSSSSLTKEVLSGYKVSELKKIADGKGIEYASNSRKKDLVLSILKAEEAARLVDAE